MDKNRDLNWAVLGTGVIANEMAQALKNAGKKVYAVGNRTHEKAVAFAEKYGNRDLVSRARIYYNIRVRLCGLHSVWQYGALQKTAACRESIYILRKEGNAHGKLSGNEP